MGGIDRHLPNSDTANKVLEQKQNVPYLPAYRPHFFQGKKSSKFGVRLIRGYKGFELINMQNFPTHTASTKLLKA